MVARSTHPVFCVCADPKCFLKKMERERERKKRKKGVGELFSNLIDGKMKRRRLRGFFPLFFSPLFLVGFLFLFCVSFCFVLPHVSLGAGSCFSDRLKRYFLFGITVVHSCSGQSD